MRRQGPVVYGVWLDLNTIVNYDGWFHTICLSCFLSSALCPNFFHRAWQLCKGDGLAGDLSVILFKQVIDGQQYWDVDWRGLLLIFVLEIDVE
jgi:hypothetical protein